MSSGSRILLTLALLLNIFLEWTATLEYFCGHYEFWIYAFLFSIIFSRLGQ